MNENEIFDFDAKYDYMISLFQAEIDISETVFHKRRSHDDISKIHPLYVGLADEYSAHSSMIEDIRQEIYDQNEIRGIDTIVLNTITDLLDNLAMYCTKVKINEIRKSTVLIMTIKSMKRFLGDKPSQSAFSVTERKIMRNFVRKHQEHFTAPRIRFDGAKGSDSIEGR